MWKIKRRLVGKTCHPAALLIHRNQQWNFTGLLQGGIEIRDLLRIPDILAELTNASHRVFFQCMAHFVRQRLHAFCLVIIYFRLRQAKIQGIRAHHEQLPHLLTQRHPGKEWFSSRCFFRSF